MREWVWVAYSHAEQQFHLKVAFEAGMTAIDAIEHSGILQHVTLSMPLTLGIFGERLQDHTQVLKAGDRVEIYRALTINPKETRRHRATNHPLKSNRLRR